MPRISGEQKVLPILYVIDASDSMIGDRMAAVNEAMHECVDILSEKVRENSQTKIRLAVVKYSDDTTILTNGFEALNEFEWDDITAGGNSNLGNAINVIDKKLLHSSVMTKDEGSSKYYCPIIIFLTSSPASDNYREFLNKANKNINFKYARKIAVLIGDECNVNELSEITGNIESVIRSNDLDTLKLLIVEADMPEDALLKYEDDYEATEQTSSIDSSTLVKVDGYENNIYLKNSWGNMLMVTDSMDIVRCQAMTCEPEAAATALFHIEKDGHTIKISNPQEFCDILISFYVGAGEERTITSCQSNFSVSFSEETTSADKVMFNLTNDGLTVSNLSSGSIYINMTMDKGLPLTLRNNDVIKDSVNMLFTVVSKEDENSESVISNDGYDLDGWMGPDDWE